MKKKKYLMLVSTLLGLILPFGNIWGPFLIKCDKALKQYRKYIVIVGIVVTVLFYIIGICVWIKEIKLLANKSTLNDSYFIYLIESFYVVIILFALVNIIYQYFSGRKIKISGDTVNS